MKPRRLTVLRGNKVIHESDGNIPPGLLQPGDCVRLSSTTWDVAEMNWLPLDPEMSLTIMGENHNPGYIIKGPLMKRTSCSRLAFRNNSLSRANDFFAPKRTDD